MPDRLGVIVPSGNTLLEPELGSLPVEDLTFHFTRIRNYLDTEEELAAMIDTAPAAAELLSQARVSAIAFGCTGGSFLKGKDYDEVVRSRMAAAVPLPCTTTSTAVVHALRSLGARRITLLTPYERWLTERGQTFLESHGFKVLTAAYLSITDPIEMVGVNAHEIARWAKGNIAEGSDAIFISCTCFRAMEAIEEIESTAGVPVVTSNQATVWHLLSMIGREPVVPGFGRLLSGQLLVTPTDAHV